MAEKKSKMKRPSPLDPTLYLLSLHDAALLIVALFLPIFFGSFNSSTVPVNFGGSRFAVSGLSIISFLVTLAALSVLIYRWLHRDRPSVIPNAIHLPALLFLAISALATVTSLSLFASVQELIRLTTGVLVFMLVANRALLPLAPLEPTLGMFLVALPFIFFTRANGESGLVQQYATWDDLMTWIAACCIVAFHLLNREHPHPVRRWMEALVFSTSFAVSVWGIQEYLINVFELKNPSWQIFSTFFNANPFAGYLVLVFFLALVLAFTARVLWQKLVFGLAAFIILFTIYPTHSKGAVLGLLFAGVVGVFLLARISRHPRRNVALLASGCALLVLAAVFLLLSPAGKARVSQEIHAPSNMFRIFTWKGTWVMARHHPVLGIGPGAFESVFSNYAIAGYTRAAHENYLQITAEQGFAGGVLYLWLLAAMLYTGWRVVRDDARPRADRLLAIGLICALVSFMVHSFFDYDWYVGAVGLTIWLFAGFLAHLAHGREPVAQEVPVPPEPVRGKRRRAEASAKPAVVKPTSEAAVHHLPWPHTSVGRTLAVLSVFALCSLLWWFTANSAMAYFSKEEGDTNVAAFQAALTPQAEQDGQSQYASYYLEQATEQYQRAVQFAPWWATAHEFYGTMIQSHSPQQAERELRTAISYEPMNFQYRLSLAKLFDVEKRNAEAITAYKDALRYFPQSTAMLKYLAQLYQRMGDIKNAVATYQRLIDLETKPVNVYRAIGADQDVDTNYAFAHYELGRLMLRNKHRPGPRWKIMEWHFLSCLQVIEEYRTGGAKLDKKFSLVQRPRHDRGKELYPLEAKAHYRLSVVYQYMHQPKDEKLHRLTALRMFQEYPNARAELTTEDAGSKPPATEGVVQ